MKTLCILIALMLAAGVSIFAQTATVNGAVTDSSQAVVAGASVIITNIDTGLRREIRTNETGNYTLPSFRWAAIRSRRPCPDSARNPCQK